MPTYDYKCETCGKMKEFFLPMGHEIPTQKDIEEHNKKKCSKDNTPLQRVFGAVAVSWGGVRGTTGKPTDSTSATKEKNQKLKKLYNDSKMSGMKPK